MVAPDLRGTPTTKKLLPLVSIRCLDATPRAVVRARSTGMSRAPISTEMAYHCNPDRMGGYDDFPVAKDESALTIFVRSVRSPARTVRALRNAWCMADVSRWATNTLLVRE